MRSRTIRCAIAALALVTLIASSAAAKPKSTTKKKKVPAAAAAPPKASSAARNFLCSGKPNLQLQWRNVSGTVDGALNLTNVGVTQVWQKVGDALVEQPAVVLTSANPKGSPDPVYPLLVYRLNERPTATAADIDRRLTLYQFNLPDKLPAGPTFKAGLYFDTLIGVAGSLTNEYRWSTISSITAGGLFEMDCQYT
jgi:hypothetical protein